MAEHHRPLPGYRHVADAGNVDDCGPVSYYNNGQVAEYETLLAVKSGPDIRSVCKTSQVNSREGRAARKLSEK